MADAMIDLHAKNPVEHIPPVLAAPRAKRGKGVKPAAPVIEPAAQPAAEPVSVPTAAAPAEPASKETTMATTIENVSQTATDQTAFDKAGAAFGEMNSRAKGAIEKSTALFTELNSFNKGNVEALVESGKLAIAGMQSVAQSQAAYVRKQFEEATAAAKTLTTVKSPTEFVKLQGDYVRQQFDAMVAETSRSTEAMLKLAGEVAQPISNRFALAAEKVKQAA